MADHLELGKKGEELAVAWLEQQGYEILEKNWRNAHCEIDIIALKGSLPHFIEVKTRNWSPRPVWPEENVNRQKVRNLLRAANGYLNSHRTYKDFRIDILSIILKNAEETEYCFIEDVYL
jgi:putative endonuclease